MGRPHASSTCPDFIIDNYTPSQMISHETLYALANSLGVFSMLAVIAYHFVAVNAKQMEAHANGNASR